MRRYRLVVTAKASADLVNLGDYLTKQAGAGVANRFIARLNAKLQRIGESGGVGVSRDELAAGLRMASFKGRNVYFRIAEDQCRIVRVIHASRDLRQQSFSDSDDEANP